MYSDEVTTTYWQRRQGCILKENFVRLTRFKEEEEISWNYHKKQVGRGNLWLSKSHVFKKSCIKINNEYTYILKSK